MNAMAHFAIGISGIRFLSLFGYSSTGNILYSFCQFLLVLFLIWMNYGPTFFLNNGIVVGSLSVLMIYFFLGKSFVRKYSSSDEEEDGFL